MHIQLTPHRSSHSSFSLSSNTTLELCAAGILLPLVMTPLTRPDGCYQLYTISRPGILAEARRALALFLVSISCPPVLLRKDRSVDKRPGGDHQIRRRHPGARHGVHGGS